MDDACPVLIGQVPLELLDLVVDQSPDGIELVPGAVRFTYDGNWKLQLENCSDAYHFTSAHTSYLRLLDQRRDEKQKTEKTSVWNEDRPWAERGAEGGEGVTSGTFSFQNGHVLNWNIMGVSATLPDGGAANATNASPPSTPDAMGRAKPGTPTANRNSCSSATEI